MKKILTSGIIFSMLIGVGSALADDNTALTTKNYVDSGLRAVYGVAKGVETLVGDTTMTTEADTVTEAINELNTGIGSLETTVGNQGTAITNLQTTVGNQGTSITNLQNTVGDTALQTTSQTVTGAINELKQAVGGIDTTYTGGTGITVSGHSVSVTGLADTVSDGKKYVYQNGTLTELEFANTWDDSVLTTTP